MSLLDIDKFDLDKVVTENDISERYALKPISNKVSLEKDELKDITNLIHIVDLLPSQFKNAIGFIPVFSIRHEVSVQLSPDKPLLSKLHPNIDDNTVLNNILLLGEFCKKDEIIILYLNNIKTVGKDNWKWLLTAVYIHELYHAYFDTQTYVAKVEEPLAELGALYTLKLMECLNIFDKGIFKYYKGKVDEKTGPIYFYGFGGVIYDKVEGYSQIGDFIEKFKTDSSNILSKCSLIKELYPSTADGAYNLFCELLGYK